MITVTVYPAHLIAAPHEVTDRAKVNAIAADMVTRGWQGEPVLAVRHGDGLAAWTGTHRLAAAEIAGIAVPVYVLELTDDQQDALGESGWYDAPMSRPIDQEAVLYELAQMDNVDVEALRIYRAEIAK